MREKGFIKPEEDETGETMSIYTIVACEYCGLKIPYYERWVHIGRHRQGLKQLRSVFSKFDRTKVRLPWYMHSRYQDRSVNRSRYEIIEFTELTRDSELYNLEKRVKKPFATHFWINYDNDKTGDPVKLFFGLRPYTIDYSVFGFYEFSSRQKDMPEVRSATSFDCNFCRERIHKCATLIQTIMAALVHALGNHSDNKKLYDACSADMEAIQEATGIRTHLKELPNYKPLMLHDFIFDYYYSRDIFISPNSKNTFGSYCLLCFKPIIRTSPYDINTHFSKEHKHVKIAHAFCYFDCLPASRYGHSVASCAKNHIYPYMLTENKDKNEYSWACYKCTTVLRHGDTTQLIFYAAAHIANRLGVCQSQNLYIGFRAPKTSIQEHIAQLFSQCNGSKAAIGSWNTRLKPITYNDVQDKFLKLSLRDFVNKWIFQMNDSITGRVEVCTNLGKYKALRTDSGKLKNKAVCKLGWIYICPYCFSYFLNKYVAFLHLQPEKCSQMPTGFKLTLNAKAVEKSLKKDPNKRDDGT